MFVYVRHSSHWAEVFTKNVMKAARLRSGTSDVWVWRRRPHPSERLKPPSVVAARLTARTKTLKSQQNRRTIMPVARQMRLNNNATRRCASSSGNAQLPKISFLLPHTASLCLEKSHVVSDPFPRRGAENGTRALRECACVWRPCDTELMVTIRADV